MATAEYVVDAALRKLGIPGHGDVRSTDTSNVSTYINAALRHLNLPNAGSEAADSTETVQQYIDAALRKLGQSNKADEAANDTATAASYINAALQHLNIPHEGDEAADSSETVQNYIDAALRKLEVVDSTNEGTASTATAKEVSEHALRLIGAIDPAEGGSTGELSDAYDALNRMIREWIADGIYLPNYTDVANDADTVNVPSSAILPIVHNLAGVLAPEYGTQLSETGLSVAINSKNRLRRNPTDHMNELNRMLHDWESEGIALGFSEYALLTNAVNLPKNVATAVIDNLAVRLAPEYGKQPPETVLQQAVNEKQDLRKDSGDHLTTMNQMLHEWEASGIDLGFSEIALTTDSVNVPKNAAPAIIHNLAFRLAFEYGREPPQLTVEMALAEKTRLLRDHDDHLRELNRMLFDWEYEDIVIGFSEYSLLSDAVNLPKNVGQTVIDNLALRLAPEYDVQPPEVVVQQATEGKRNLRKNSSNHLTMLNQMLHEWEATGIDLGFNEYSNLTDNVNLPKNAAPAIIHNLAFRLAPEYGREPPQLTVELAQAEKSRLTRKPEDDRNALNDMLLDWEADGINLGFRPVDVLEQNLRVPDNALNPIIYNLAVTLAPDYSAQPRQDVFQRAREGRKRLERDSATEIIMSTSHLPGSKPKRFNIDSID